MTGQGHTAGPPGPRGSGRGRSQGGMVEEDPRPGIAVTGRRGGVPWPPAPPREVELLTFLSRSINTLLLPPVSRFRFFSSARRSITRRSLSRRVPASETPDPTAAVPEPDSPDPARGSAIPGLASPPPTSHTAGGCSGSEHKMAPPKRKTHSLPPAPLSGRACVPPMPAF